MEYQKWLIEIRPEIIIKSTDFSLTEQFQNLTIRPILKLLNNSIIAFSKSFLASLEITFKNKTANEIESLISNLFNKHPTFKIYLIGMIISYLTKEELSIYLDYRKEINKRIYILLHERLRSQISLLVS